MIGAARRATGRLAEVGRGRRLRVRTDDGFDLYARVHRAQGSRACVVLSHGITSDSREGGMFTKFARAANGRRMSVVRFDFRGHGRSQGTDRDFLLSTQRRDLAAALVRVRELDLGPTFLLGMSFGASPAVAEMLSAHPYPGLVLWSPMVDYARSCLQPSTPWARQLLSERGDRSLPEWAFAPVPLTRFQFSKALAEECERDPTATTLRSMPAPVLAFSASGDEIVPFEPMAEVAAGNTQIDFRPLADEVHDLRHSHGRVISETLDWVEARL